MNVSDGRVTTVSPMISPRSSFSVAVTDDYILVFGGYCGNNVLSSCEKYDPIAER